MTRLRLLSICALALGGGAISCVGILGFDRLHVEGGDGIEASVDDAGDDASTAPNADVDSGACGLVGIPDPPTDGGAGIGPPVYFALRTLDFGGDLDAGTVTTIAGFNLDRTCSVDIATSSCLTNVLESTFDNAAKDKSPAGLDNAGFTLIQYINGFSNLLNTATLNAAIADGKYGVVIRLTGWNGLPQDDSAQVELFPALAFAAPNDGGATKPTFTATDRWVLDDRFQLAPLVIASTITSQQAYVTNGVLIAHLKQVTVPIKLTDDPKPFDIRVQDAVLQGTLVATNGITVLTNATIAGRWKTSDFLGEVRTIHVGSANDITDKDLCNPGTPQAIYGQVRANVCDARDIRADSQDNAKLPCDAVSAALKLEAYAIGELGDFDAGPVIPARCTGDGDTAANDDCTR